ncbi:similar to Saccharomyces cerevisiae YJL209W CBP1 Mitochondrial protein that interacts with the 5'-untranslated region of the COB mRNA and has a role in its stability and translation [Maudiozyma saulgeensis]|uniref:Similar to Saccharomyces cerevisiae YJL209W CBP1 Mitochondrial protein that interacts with the 5'-untranslated region of the COB mRNA and has a role in its stability and translation n=1 Tax=Maudiozyma saulgeensis TaxID=1789683 RepID=A0A1X7QY39_9SACH|nr:similar to Saccharomyces cerevisiae YJL209W CBP1 Mitochondrial protein that interacts with the 5'-untranslated region of the COB mRNA and has a role in its stability and translation [Kazachstania saulgeensis]
MFCRPFFQCVTIRHLNYKVYASPYKKLYSQTTTKGQSLVNNITDIINNDKILNGQNNYMIREYWKYRSETVSSDANLHVNKQNLFELSLVHNIEFNKFVQFVKKNNQISSTSRGLYRREIIYNIRDRKLISEVIGRISTDPYDSNMSEKEIFMWCLNDAIKTQDFPMVIDLYILYHNLYPESKLDTKLASKILSATSFNNPKINDILLRNYLRLEDLFQTQKMVLPLTNFQFYTLNIMAQSLRKAPHLEKEVKRQLMTATLESSLLNGDNQSQLNIAYSLIKFDCNINNPAGVLVVWNQIKDMCNPVTQHDPRVIFNIFKIFNKNTAYNNECAKLIEELSPVYICNNPLLLPEILRYISRTSSLQLAQSIIRNMRSFASQSIQVLLWNSKDYLSSLFEMQLSFQDYKNSNQTMKRIEELYGSLSTQEYMVIAQQLLRNKSTETILQALKLLDSIPAQKRLPLYPMIINKLLEWDKQKGSKLNESVFPLINEFLMKVHRIDHKHELPLWEYIAAIYTKFLVDGVPSSKNKINKSNLDLAKYLYIKSSTNMSDKICSYNPWSMQNPMDIKIKLTKRNRLVILRTIADSSKKLNRYDIYMWCCSMLNSLGVLTSELKTDWEMRKQSRNRKTDGVK